ncbi:hypothetical protein Pst134EA_020739 [Puccinia striiformis f. sp. tritici]|uniref:hypothetical protein n=1 Tax=Puccinia striiformis f. sp. tritici TaxID=168172 RepID=UPI0020074467|nr:hypothetical protein Pst134EA_020739 [Puccinia striiformis f. sp. tritici]KAH9456827.1 hypothetical protein Pst134EA_020739 [Puccinia striiformis f. sp. tritici]
MSTTSQSENDSRSPARPRPRAQVDPSLLPAVPGRRTHSNVRIQSASHRGSPYTPPLRGSRAAEERNRAPDSSGSPRPRSPIIDRNAHPSRALGTVQYFGTQRAGIFRAWPPAVIPFEVSENYLDEDFATHMNRTYDLQAPYAAFAEELMEVPSPRQYATLMYTILSVRQAVESLLRSRDVALAAPQPPAATASLAAQARLFVYQRFFRTFVQAKAKEVLLDPLLEVYQCDPIRGALPAGRTLLEQVSDHVRIQSDEFKRDYLPLGYINSEPTAEASVNTELRDRLKHERGAMRNMLLSMIHDPHGRTITHPVPTLTNLIIDMRTRMLPSGGERAAEYDLLHSNSRVRTRIAYLRIQTIAHYARPAPGDINRQWALIDEQLRELRMKEPAYRRAFFKLIVELDDATFGDQFYSQIDVDSIRAPTEAEVLAKMVLLAGERPVLPA